MASIASSIVGVMSEVGLGICLAMMMAVLGRASWLMVVGR